MYMYVSEDIPFFQNIRECIFKVLLSLNSAGPNAYFGIKLKKN